MVSISSVDIRPPSDWQDFERLVRDLFESEWKTDDALAHGRTGQEQWGVDVYGTDQRTGKFIGIQCKGRTGGYGKGLKEKELREEAEKAKAFTPKLQKFILATTAPSDVHIQKVARELNKQNVDNRLFEVAVLSWEDLKGILDRNPNIISQHMQGVSSLAAYEIRELLKQQSEEFAQQFQRLSGAILDVSASASASTVPERQTSDDPLDQRITFAAELLEDSPAQSSISRLKRILETDGPTASPRHRFRIKANIGAGFYAEGDKSSAIQWYRDAYEEMPDTPDSISILAAAELMSGNDSEAARLAKLAMESAKPPQRAVGIFLETAPKEISWKELKAEIPEIYQHTPEFLVALAERAFDTGQIDDCRKLVQDAVRRDPENWRVRAHAGYLAFEEVAQRRDVRIVSLASKAEVSLMQASREHFLAAWNTLKNSGWSSEAESCLMNTITCSLMLNDEEMSRRLIGEAGRYSQSPYFLRLQAIYFMHKRQHTEVVDLISKIAISDRVPNDELMLLQGQIFLGKPQDAIDHGTALYNSAQEEDLRAAYGSLLMLATKKIDDDLFKKTAKELLAADPNSTLLLAGYIINDQAAAEDTVLVDRLVAAVESENDPYTRDRAAVALAKAGRYSEAADIYLSVCNPEIDTPQLHMALQALVNARRIREARELYAKLDQAVKNTPDMRRNGAVIFLNSGDLRKARAELEWAFNHGGETTQDRAYWIDFCERLSDKRAIRVYLESVPVDITGDPRARMHIAQKMDFYLNKPETALEIGYRALRDGYDDPDLHAAYMVGLILTGKGARRMVFEHSVVQLGSAVTIVRAYDGPFTRVIETAPDPRLDRDEISPKEPLATELLGKSVGHSFTLPSVMGEQTAEITDIRSKYLNLHHRVNTDFHRLFPESQLFGSLTFDENDVEGSFRPIFESARRRSEQISRIEEAYKSGAAPIAILAAYCGGSSVDLWDHLRHHDAIKLSMAIGSGAERAKATKAVMTAPGMIIDPLTLYAAQCLDIVGYLIEAYPDLHITQSGIDLLYDAHKVRSEAIEDPERRGIIVAKDETVGMVEVPKETSEQLASDIDKALEVARQLKIAMPEEGVGLRSQIEVLFDNAHPSFLDTLTVAKERGWALLSDDTALRLCAGSAGIPSAWCQVALQLSRNQGMISQKAYSDTLGAYLDGNHTYVSIDGESIQYEWRTSDSSPWLTKFLDVAALPTNDRWSIAQLFGAGFLQFYSEHENDDMCKAYAAFVYREMSDRLGVTDAKKLLNDSINAAVARAQRNARRKVLPPYLWNTTTLNDPESLVEDSNRMQKAAVEKAVGTLVRSAIEEIDNNTLAHGQKQKDSCPDQVGSESIS